ncbi:hypothetical protein [Phocaeicola sp.]|uniref:hypothetical protein n=1 Tax=Phocaeicola sp. TaxID=2773926 RepID=UPI0023C7C0BB|nr:hypothetical protein [Phocaeicola sp.]MDE5678735.1 hypothetical protein [Phocaeicola sp.]
MVNFFNRIYSISFNGNLILAKLKINSLIRYVIRILANRILPLYLSGRSHYGLFVGSRKRNIIISLTSFPNRIPKLWLVIETLLSQSVKPDKVILYLSKVQFPEEEKNLPNSLLNMKKRGLDIEFVEGDIRSHKKYYYVMQTYPTDLVITVDDDIFYPTTMVQTLLYYHDLYPEAIICRYAKSIVWDEHSIIKSSSNWPRIYKTRLEGQDIFLGTGGGTLFPIPSVSLYQDTLNITLALNLCPLEDDLWLNTMIRLQKTKIVVVKNYRGILPVLNAKDVMLYSTNGGESNLTDNQLNKTILYYEQNDLAPYERIYT